MFIVAQEGKKVCNFSAIKALWVDKTKIKISHDDTYQSTIGEFGTEQEATEMFVALCRAIEQGKSFFRMYKTGNSMTKEQKELLESSDRALVALHGWYQSLSRDGKNDMAKMVKAAYDIFREMRQEWSLAIGHPQEISEETLSEILQAVSTILRRKSAN